jgi:recombinational DNA repair protein RecR
MKRIKLASKILHGMLANPTNQKYENSELVEYSFRLADMVIKKDAEIERKILDEKIDAYEKMLSVCRGCCNYESCMEFDLCHDDCRNFEEKEGKE